MSLFSNPAVLLAFYDPNYHGGQHALYPWQIKVLSDFALRSPTEPKEILAVMPNGAGKSSVVLASAAIWTAMNFHQSQTAITSASSGQLDVQTMRAVGRLARYVNEFHGAELWDVKYRHLEFKPTGSVIDARKSDEEGTQEGFHPLVPGGEFSILVDEGKSIPDTIYNGILKWTGYTRRMDVTSAGDPCGVFYRDWCHGQKQSRHHVIADQCPNITEAAKNRIIVSSGGPDTPLAQQVLWSRFVALAGTVVLSLAALETLLRLIKNNAVEHRKEELNRAGLDLSGGGDETIVSIWNGNKQLGIELVPFHDPRQIETHIATVVIPNNQLRLERIWADAGGIGRRMILSIEDQVRAKFGSRYGERINRVYNQAKPVGILKKNFGNRGTEMWYHFAALVQDAQIIPLDDPKQNEQLANRYYRQQAHDDKIIVEPKSEALAQGRPSPDRADAAILAMAKYQHEGEAEEPEKKKTMTSDELMQWFDELQEGKFDPESRTGELTMEHVVGIRQEELRTG